VRRAAAALLAAALAAPLAANARADFQKGFTLGGWTRDDYARPELAAQLRALRDGGVEWVALTARWLQAERTSTAIAPHPERSPSDASLRTAVRAAHATGLRVFLKPQLDLVGEGWRGEIALRSEADWRAWFASYEAFILHYAALAQEERVALFCVGVELDATRQREADWRRVVAAVRARYAGPLVYAANWGRERDIRWWDALDYAGVDAYFPLAESAEPTLAEVRAGWQPHLAALRAWAARIGKPVLFTEIGYRSARNAGREPWEYLLEQPPAPAQQALLYRAALETFWREPWFAGLYWWIWDTRPPADPARDASFTPQGKPAWEVLREFYGRSDRGAAGIRFQPRQEAP
jgi:hypothetical protein